jgi:hypothetical protein
MHSAYHAHPEFGYFCPTPYRRRELRVAIVSILFGAMIGGSIATLRAGHDPNPDGASTAAHVHFSNSERVPVAAAEATPAAPNDADTKVEAKESIKPFPIRRVRVRPAAHNPPISATDPTAGTSAGVVASASPLVEPPESAQGSGPPAASSHATKSAAAQRPSAAVKKRQRIAHVQSRRRNDERADYSWHDSRGNYWTGRTYVDAYYLGAR